MNTTISESNSMSARYPDLFLYHLDGGHIYRSNRIPTHKQEGLPSKFKILPLDEHNKIQELPAPFSSRAAYIASLARWKKVVIQDEKGKFVQCGTFLTPTKSALAWYSCEIGDSNFEVFDLEYYPTTATFSFKSYNGLYLHYNDILGTVAFKTREGREASWHVHPLSLAASDSEQIMFVGVVNNDKEFLLQRTAEGVGNDWKNDLDMVLKMLLEGLAANSCTMFQHPTTQHQWCVARSSDGERLNIVVSSELYPKMFASECVEDLELICEQFGDSEKDDELKKYGIDKTEHYLKSLAALMYDYDDQYSYSVFASAHQDIQKAMDQMTDNITKMQENIASAEELKETTDELLEFASNFKKQSSELSHIMQRRTVVLSSALIGGASGAAAGFLIGGPGSAAVLAVEAAEVAVGLGLGIFLGTSTATACTSRFWKRSFISFGTKMTFS
mmetsp:Transcript_19646/g.29410  ORF Transcript_19646/g.29410 Transcript_19646/m.29410 type:complete len:445 (-) Transcript_19646:141-1475(-)